MQIVKQKLHKFLFRQKKAASATLFYFINNSSNFPVSIRSIVDAPGDRAYFIEKMQDFADSVAADMDYVYEKIGNLNNQPRFTVIVEKDSNGNWVRMYCYYCAYLIDYDNYYAVDVYNFYETLEEA